MAESHVLSGLVNRRAELAGERADLIGRAKSLKDDIATLEAAIKVIEPSYNLRTLTSKKKQKPNGFFAHGESTSFVLDCLREATAPISTIELATMAAKAKNLELDRHDRQRLDACILTTVSRQRRKGVVVEAGRGADGAIEWRLAQ